MQQTFRVAPLVPYLWTRVCFFFFFFGDSISVNCFFCFIFGRFPSVLEATSETQSVRQTFLVAPLVPYLRIRFCCSCGSILSDSSGLGSSPSRRQSGCTDIGRLVAESLSSKMSFPVLCTKHTTQTTRVPNTCPYLTLHCFAYFCFLLAR